MAENANLQGSKVNHSGRKTFATTLLQNGRPITAVAQLGGWKNVGTLTHYLVPSRQQQQEASHTISSVMLSDLQEENTINVEESSTINDQAMNPTNTLVNTNISNNQNSNKHDNPLALLCGATVLGGVMNINVYSRDRKSTINCSQ